MSGYGLFSDCARNILLYFEILVDCIIMRVSYSRYESLKRILSKFLRGENKFESSKHAHEKSDSLVKSSGIRTCAVDGILFSYPW